MPKQPALGITSSELYKRARRVLAGGISHENRYVEPYPLYMVRGQGSHMWDVEGKEYVDYCMGSASLLLGHSHPDVVQAIRDQAGRGTFYGNCHPTEIEWGELIQELVPSAERVRFVASGTEATLLGMRLARAHTGRNKILRFEAHYHGWHDYAVLGMTPPYDRMPTLGALRESANTTVVCPTDSTAVEDALRRDEDIAAIICEVSGASYGTVPLSTDFLRALRTLADRYGAVLIFDEVITGFRWSPGGVQALAGVTPDLTALAKILTGGLPGGAIVGREKIMQLLDPMADKGSKRLGVSHKGTFNGSPLVAAAAVAALKVIRTGEPQRRADLLATRLRDGMQSVLSDLQANGMVYGESSTFHIYFGTTQYDSLAKMSSIEIKSVAKDTVDAYRRGMRQRGMDLMSYLGGVTSSAHTNEDIDQMVGAFRDTVKDLIETGKVGRIEEKVRHRETVLDPKAA